jgi:putative endonuclease
MDWSLAGRTGEDLAALFLGLEGYTVLGRNLRTAGVEVDLVARRDALLVLVEVKLRRHGVVPATEAAGVAQRRRLGKAAAALVARAPWAEVVRLDLVGIDWRRGELRLRHVPGIPAG